MPCACSTQEGVAKALQSGAAVTYAREVSRLLEDNTRVLENALRDMGAYSIPDASHGTAKLVAMATINRCTTAVGPQDWRPFRRKGAASWW